MKGGGVELRAVDLQPHHVVVEEADDDGVEVRDVRRKRIVERAGDADDRLHGRAVFAGRPCLAGELDELLRVLCVDLTVGGDDAAEEVGHVAGVRTDFGDALAGGGAEEGEDFDGVAAGVEGFVGGEAIGGVDGGVDGVEGGGRSGGRGRRRLRRRGR